MFVFPCFFQQIKYLHYRKEFLPIAEHRVHGCNAHQEQLICVYLPVPLILPTDVPTFPTKIIEVEHFIRVSNQILCCNFFSDQITQTLTCLYR